MHRPSCTAFTFQFTSLGLKIMVILENIRLLRVYMHQLFVLVWTFFNEVSHRWNCCDPNVINCIPQGYPLHMNLAVSQALSPNRNQEDSDEQNRIAMLKAQNKMLTQVSVSCGAKIAASSLLLIFKNAKKIHLFL